MTRIKIKRAYEKPEPDDGFRVFVDRLWPRGMRKEDFRYDLWAKQIAPSAALRRWYHEDMPGRWEEFGRRYAAELRQPWRNSSVRSPETTPLRWCTPPGTLCRIMP